jgi:hypothetical protein
VKRYTDGKSCEVFVLVGKKQEDALVMWYMAWHFRPVANFGCVRLQLSMPVLYIVKPNNPLCRAQTET